MKCDFHEDWLYAIWYCLANPKQFKYNELYEEGMIKLLNRSYWSVKDYEDWLE